MREGERCTREGERAGKEPCKREGDLVDSFETVAREVEVLASLEVPSLNIRIKPVPLTNVTSFPCH